MLSGDFSVGVWTRLYIATLLCKEIEISYKIARHKDILPVPLRVNLGLKGNLLTSLVQNDYNGCADN